MKSSKLFSLCLAWLLIFFFPFTSSIYAEKESIIIENITLIDGTGHPPINHVFVLIQGNRITKVDNNSIKIPKGAIRIDGKGKYLIPGLMDVHIHLHGGRNQDENTGLWALHSYIYCGITSIFDCGNDADFIMKLREKERSFQIVSPRIFATGPLCTYPGSHGGGPGGVLIDDWPNDIPKVDDHIALKPDLAKLTYEEHGWGTRPLIPKFPVDLMQKIIHYYNSHGIRTIIHTSSELYALDSIYAGADVLAHPVIQSPITKNFAKLMAAKKIPMISTLTIGEGYSRLVDHPEFLDQPFYQAVLDPDEIKRLKTEEREKQNKRSWTWWMKIMTPIAQENLRMVHEAGGVIALGTDQSIGPAAHRELELLVEGGISPLDAIRMGTLNAAIVLNMDQEIGSIEEGKLADLVMLNADPLANINNIKKIHTVIKDGKIIDRSKLNLPINKKDDSK